jgi:hypothetical protein
MKDSENKQTSKTSDVTEKKIFTIPVSGLMSKEEAEKQISEMIAEYGEVIFDDTIEINGDEQMWFPTPDINKF